MRITDSDFIARCNRQAQAYAAWRKCQDKSTERALRLAIAAVRDALRPRGDEPMLDVIRKELALIRTLIATKQPDVPGRETHRARLRRMEIAEENELRRLKRLDEQPPPE